MPRQTFAGVDSIFSILISDLSVHLLINDDGRKTNEEGCFGGNLRMLLSIERRSSGWPSPLRVGHVRQSP